jgi:hypothetical protein
LVVKIAEKHLVDAKFHAPQNQPKMNQDNRIRGFQRFLRLQIILKTLYFVL